MNRLILIIIIMLTAVESATAQIPIVTMRVTHKCHLDLSARLDSLALVVAKLEQRTDPRRLRYVLIKIGEPGVQIYQVFKRAQSLLPILHVAGFDMVAGGPVTKWLFSTRLSPAEADSIIKSMGLGE